MGAQNKVKSDNCVKILVNNGRTLSDIKMDFQQRYPFLKIEFFLSKRSDGVARREKLADDYKLKKPVLINMATDRSVADVKKDILEKFELIALVYRKSGNVWVETSHTDHWPLEQQNSEGEQMNE